MNNPESYAEKLQDPQWQAKRLEILSRDQFNCQNCGWKPFPKSDAKGLEVHHHWYESGKEPWEYPNEALITLCFRCHEGETLLRSEMEHDLLFALKRAGYLGPDLRALAKSLPKPARDHYSTPEASQKDRDDRWRDRRDRRQELGLSMEMQ